MVNHGQNRFNSRLKNKHRNLNVNFLEHSGKKNNISHGKDDSSRGSYSNQFVQNHTKLNRNENGQNSRLPKAKQNILNKVSCSKQSTKNSDLKNCENYSKSQSKKKSEMERNQSVNGKARKAVKIKNRRQDEEWEEMTEQVTATTFSQTRIVKRGACNRQDSDSSGPDIPPVASDG